MTLRAVYVDLDDTLLGRGASLLHDGDGAFSLLGARALEACARAGAEVVAVSGRRRALVEEDARLLGLRAYAFEAGAGLAVDGELEWLAGGPDTHAHTAASGALELLLAHFPGLAVDPHNDEREVTHLLRGEADPEAADALLEAHGHGHLRLLDNGASFHLLPRGASKAFAVARHQQIRGLAPSDTIAIGDSREDLGMAAVVGTYWAVANGVGAPDARRTEESYGAGVYEAVLTTLAERR
ncbi:MAG TPA: HAD hydrolase family protein [Solirubrobacteraceae bacterium]